jgi:CheY-like chemotaxis protein
MAKRILIADDSLTIQKAFAMTFAGEDVTLLAARSADEGLTMARQAHPELVIADAVMPGRSGYDLCSAIKSDSALRGVPVYILVSSQNPYDDARGRQSGVDGQFTKPFESVAFVERVKEAIAKGSMQAAAPAPAARSPLSAPTAAPAASFRPAPAPRLPPDDDYGEISIATAPSDLTPPPRAPVYVPQRPVMPTAQPAAAMNPPGGMRPSLIPGLRPGVAPSVRPGTMPVRPLAVPGSTTHTASPSPGVWHPPVAGPPAGSPAAPAAPAPAPSTAAVSAGPARTLVGLPAAIAQSPARFGAPAAPARPSPQPVHALDSRTPVPVSHAPGILTHSTASTASTAITSKIDQKVAAFAAKGPEYEAIAKLSREIIEKIVWEVVPELAEMIVREELQKRGRI